MLLLTLLSTSLALLTMLHLRLLVTSPPMLLKLGWWCEKKWLLWQYRQSSLLLLPLWGSTVAGVVVIVAALGTKLHGAPSHYRCNMRQ